MPLRITTWNVNGIRNPFGYQPWRDKRTFDAMFDILETDIVIMQELKIQRKDLRDDMVLVPGWDCYFSLPKHKKGYSGVGIYTRQSVCAPIRAEEGLLGILCPPDSTTPYREMPDDKSIGGYPTVTQIADLNVDPAALDAEGRCLVLEFPAFVLFGLYSPANSNGLRDDFRYGFLCALDARIRNLVSMGKNVVVTGDLNVSRSEIDTASAEEARRKEGITHEEYISTPNRRIFNQLLEGGEVVEPRDEGRESPVLWDICRGFHEGRKGMYTHWEQKINARPGNYGSRIDYVLCSLTMKDWFYESNIQEGLMGSDHCPVYAVAKDRVTLHSNETHILDVMNPPGMFLNGERQREYTTKDTPSTSGRLLPEFDRRRSIKTMFSRHSTAQQQQPKQSPVANGPESSQIHGTETTAELSQESFFNTPQSFAETSASTTATQISANTPSSPERKRRVIDVIPNKSNKRIKPKGQSSSTTLPTRGQSTLKGFFKPKSATPISEDDISQSPGTETSAIQTSDQSSNKPIGKGVDSTVSLQSPSSKMEENNGDDEYIIDPIVSKESWDKLFSKPAAPRCESHSEPCISYVSKKKGFNCGRTFWVCSRPLGPSGNKEKGTQWRCPTFIWASDWNGNGNASA